MKFPAGTFDSSSCKTTEQLSQRIIIKISFSYSIMLSTESGFDSDVGGATVALTPEPAALR